ncbi:uncharacterized protein AKAME5_002094400 [Lates japonicus]|uniref:Uncharacterized protein n=1 Tax=Lates japonicus TaxID=270547 RepID=A0AAD3RIY0_LATJO|nr:uncharacterized protein AKAME5_002094400 [Lates japonicus]
MCLAIYLSTFASLGFLQLLNAQDIPCTVTQEAGCTVYRIPDFNATNCHYWWTNVTDFVLANHEKKIDGLVEINSNTTLTTYACSDQIKYTRDCISEGVQHKTTCFTNCSGNPDPLGQEFPHTHWIAPLAAGVILVLVGIILWYRTDFHYGSGVAE